MVNVCSIKSSSYDNRMFTVAFTMKTSTLFTLQRTAQPWVFLFLMQCFRLWIVLCEVIKTDFSFISLVVSVSNTKHFLISDFLTLYNFLKCSIKVIIKGSVLFLIKVCLNFFVAKLNFSVCWKTIWNV